VVVLRARYTLTRAFEDATRSTNGKQRCSQRLYNIRDCRATRCVRGGIFLFFYFFKINNNHCTGTTELKELERSISKNVESIQLPRSVFWYKNQTVRTLRFLCITIRSRNLDTNRVNTRENRSFRNVAV